MHNLSYGKDFDFQDNLRSRKTHFHMKGLYNETRFETEEKGNSGMAYWFNFFFFFAPVVQYAPVLKERITDSHLKSIGHILLSF